MKKKYYLSQVGNFTDINFRVWQYARRNIYMDKSLMQLNTRKSYLTRMVNVLNYIQDNLDKELTLQELAAEACFSSYHFHRIFSGMLGESVKELVRRLRLERAAIQLQTSTTSILEIALSAGYESDMAFSRMFKVKTGLSPSVFRRSLQIKYPCLTQSTIRYVTNERIASFEPFREKELNMNVIIKHVDDILVGFVRHVGPYQDCGPAWDTLCCALAPEGLLGGDAKMIGVSHDDPDVIAAQKLRYDACITVPKDFSGIDGVAVKSISGGRYAMTTHIGSYETLGTTYRQIFGQWLSQSDFEPADKPCFEIYLNDPESTAPEDLVTDIYIPLEED